MSGHQHGRLASAVTLTAMLMPLSRLVGNLRLFTIVALNRSTATITRYDIRYHFAVLATNKYS